MVTILYVIHMFKQLTIDEALNIMISLYETSWADRFKLAAPSLRWSALVRDGTRNCSVKKTVFCLLWLVFIYSEALSTFFGKRNDTLQRKQLNTFESISSNHVDRIETGSAFLSHACPPCAITERGLLRTLQMDIKQNRCRWSDAASENVCSVVTGTRVTLFSVLKNQLWTNVFP